MLHRGGTPTNDDYRARLLPAHASQIWRVTAGPDPAISSLGAVIAPRKVTQVDTHTNIDIEIEIDGTEYRVHTRTLTGAQIKALANVPAANLLYRVEGNKRVLIGDAEHVHLHDDEKFITTPPVGGAS